MRYECVRFYLNHLNTHSVEQLHTANNCEIRYGTKFSNIINVLSKYQCISQKLGSLQHSAPQIHIGSIYIQYTIVFEPMNYNVFALVKNIALNAYKYTYIVAPNEWNEKQ